MSTQDLLDGAGDPATGPGAVAVRVHRVEPSDWASHRDLRLAMLGADPRAFWADLATVRRWEQEQWREEILGPRIHLQARRGADAHGGIALLPAGYTPEHVIPADRAHIVSLWVRPEARGARLAHLLIGAVAELALDLGRPQLHLDVDETNAPARELYRSLGFRETGQRELREDTRTSWVEYAARADDVAAGAGATGA